MHIYSSSQISQVAALIPTQSAQQAAAVKQAAAEVRRKLTSFAATSDEDTIQRIDPRGEADPDRKRNPQNDDEQFRSVFFSISI